MEDWQQMTEQYQEYKKKTTETVEDVDKKIKIIIEK